MTIGPNDHIVFKVTDATRAGVVRQMGSGKFYSTIEATDNRTQGGCLAMSDEYKTRRGALGWLRRNGWSIS